MRTAVALAAAAASLPHGGVLAPGHTLAGVHIGESATEVRRSLGAHGACNGCATMTWYFTYAKFTQPGLAVEFRGGRVSATYTIWQPNAWHTTTGVRLGAVEAQVAKLAGPLTPVVCPAYTVLVHDTPGVRTAYYIVDGKLWGFGLMRARTSPCR